MTPWQSACIDRLHRCFAARDDVVALAIFGSAVRPGAQPDAWSDVDVVLVVKDDTLDATYASLGWIEPLGTLYASEERRWKFTRTARCVFIDGSQIDFVLTSPAELAQLDRWTYVPFCEGVQILFSRSEEVAQVLTREFPPPALRQTTEGEFEALAREFRFKAMLAVHKVARNDLPIAAMVTLGLQERCCSLALMLRNRAQETGLNSLADAGWLVGLAHGPSSAAGILDTVEQSARLFDRLGTEWSEEYEGCGQVLGAAIARARAELLRA
jgi:hypothetical protein